MGATKGILNFELGGVQAIMGAMRAMGEMPKLYY